MKAFAFLPLLALAACGGAATGNSSMPSAPVAAVQAPAGTTWSDSVRKTDEGHVMGNPNAPIKLVEYGSRLCPTCGALANDGYKPLVDKYVDSGKVSFEFREYMVHGAPDLPPTLLGNCTDDAAFFPILEQMFANQTEFNNKLQSTPPALQQQMQAARPVDAIRIMAEQMGLIDFVKQRGIPEAKARACLADSSQIDRWTKQTADRSADGSVTGTPTLFINGQKADAVSWGQLEPLLKNAGA